MPFFDISGKSLKKRVSVAAKQVKAWVPMLEHFNRLRADFS